MTSLGQDHCPFVLGGLHCAPGCGDICLLADAERNKLRRWQVDRSGFSAGGRVSASAEPLFIRCAIAMSLDADGVERPGPGEAPTAFRFWKAGDNVTDYGVHRFTGHSAKLLLEEQATREKLYSVDVAVLLAKDAQTDY